MKNKVLLREYRLNPPVVPQRMIWTSSSTKLFRKCKRKFFWYYMMRLNPKYRNVNLIFGSHEHNVMETFYRKKNRPMRTILKPIVKELEADLESGKEFYDQSEIDKANKHLDIFTGMNLAYGDHYKMDRKNMNILEIEKTFHIEFDNFDFEGAIDLVYENKLKKGRVEYMDHKTAAQMGSSYFDKLEMDTQMRAYWFACKHKNGLGLPVKNGVYNVLKKSMKRRKADESMKDFTARIHHDYKENAKDYFYRHPLRYNQAELNEVITMLHQVDAEYHFIIDNYDPLDPMSWGFNDSACEEFFSLCKYQELCTKGLDRGSQGLYTQRDTLHQELTTK